MKTLIPVLICLFLAIPCQAGIIYVDTDANGANDGTSWENAFNYLQDVLADPNFIVPEEIWVAQGTYKPDQGGGETPGDRTATFQLISDVAIYGGFPSGGGTWNQRDPNTYETTLSGDLNDDDVQVDPCDLYHEPTRAENSFHVVTGSGTDGSAVLDGFTITAGNGSYGGGMYNNPGSPSVTNCTFSGNYAGNGGGMHNDNNSSPTLTNCNFSGNSAGNHGGGMFNWHSDPTVTNCTFTGNLAEYAAGMYNNDGSPAVTNCTFSGNAAQVNGGGMRSVLNSSPRVTNCTFTGNLAGFDGGGMHNGGGSPTLTNCTFSGNSAEIRGGGMCNRDSNPAVTLSKLPEYDRRRRADPARLEAAGSQSFPAPSRVAALTLTGGPMSNWNCEALTHAA